MGPFFLKKALTAACIVLAHGLAASMRFRNRFLAIEERADPSAVVLHIVPVDFRYALTDCASGSASITSLATWGDIAMVWGPTQPLVALAAFLAMWSQILVHNIAVVVHKVVWQEHNARLMKRYLYFGLVCSWLLAAAHGACNGAHAISLLFVGGVPIYSLLIFCLSSKDASDVHEEMEALLGPEQSN